MVFDRAHAGLTQCLSLRPQQRPQTAVVFVPRIRQRPGPRQRHDRKQRFWEQCLRIVLHGSVKRRQTAILGKKYRISFANGIRVHAALISAPRVALALFFEEPDRFYSRRQVIQCVYFCYASRSNPRCVQEIGTEPFRSHADRYAHRFSRSRYGLKRRFPFRVTQ